MWNSRLKPIILNGKMRRILIQNEARLVVDGKIGVVVKQCEILPRDEEVVKR